MPRVTIQCDVNSTADVTQSSSGSIMCPNGTLMVVEQSPSISSLDFDDIDWLMGQVVIMLFFAVACALLLRFTWVTFFAQYFTKGD